MRWCSGGVGAVWVSEEEGGNVGALGAARQAKFQRPPSHLQPFGGMCLYGLSDLAQHNGIWALMLVPKRASNDSREIHVGITPPRHHFSESCMNDLCFWTCEKGTPSSV